jgi:hypothetical protein
LTGVSPFESLLWTGWVLFGDEACGAHAARIAASRRRPVVDERTPTGVTGATLPPGQGTSLDLSGGRVPGQPLRRGHTGLQSRPVRVSVDRRPRALRSAVGAPPPRPDHGSRRLGYGRVPHRGPLEALLPGDLRPQHGARGWDGPGRVRRPVPVAYPRRRAPPRRARGARRAGGGGHARRLPAAPGSRDPRAPGPSGRGEGVWIDDVLVGEALTASSSSGTSARAFVSRRIPAPAGRPLGRRVADPAGRPGDRLPRRHLRPPSERAKALRRRVDPGRLRLAPLLRVHARGTALRGGGVERLPVLDAPSLRRRRSGRRRAPRRRTGMWHRPGVRAQRGDGPSCVPWQPRSYWDPTTRAKSAARWRSAAA